jgi:hypothetical protein
MLLILADRVDVLEHNQRTLLRFGAAVGIATAALYAAVRLRRSS